MGKTFYKKKTFWGALGIGLELTLRSLAVDFGIPDGLLFAVGTFLSVWGFRDAVENRSEK